MKGNRLKIAGKTLITVLLFLLLTNNISLHNYCSQSNRHLCLAKMINMHRVWIL